LTKKSVKRVTDVAPSKSLGQAATHGLAWLAAQTLAVKAVTIAGQLILAWLLLPADFGLIGLALTILSIASILQQTGLREILIQRHERFSRWQHAATSLSVLLGMGGFVLMVLMAPAAARIFHEPRIIPLIWILSLTLPANGLTVVPNAKLQVDLRFRTIAWIGFSTPIIGTVVTVLLAYCNFGASSVAYGQVASALSRATITYAASGLKFPRKWHPRRWRFLYADSGWMTGATLCTTVVLQGDYFVLGLTQPAAVVGVYYFAFNLSTQALQLVTVNLASILLPTLSKLQGGAEQRTAKFLEATALLAYIGVPVCVLQASLARPLVEAVYIHRWDAAILPLQILSIAMIPAVIGGSSATLFQSQGRFRSCFYFTVASAFVFLACVSVGAKLGAATAVAMSVAVAFSIISVMGLLWSASPLPGAPRKIATLLLGPIALAAGAWVPVFIAGTWLANRFASHFIIYSLIIGVCFPAVYGAGVRMLFPRVWYSICERLPIKRVAFGVELER